MPYSAPIKILQLIPASDEQYATFRYQGGTYDCREIVAWALCEHPQLGCEQNPYRTIEGVTKLDQEVMLVSQIGGFVGYSQ